MPDRGSMWTRSAKISDALTEQYSFSVPLSGATATGSHVLTLRVFDRYENEGSAQVSVSASQQ